MNKPLVEQQASCESPNVPPSSLLNDLDSSRSKRHYRSLFERGTPREASKYDSFFDSYDNMYESGLLDPRCSLDDCTCQCLRRDCHHLTPPRPCRPVRSIWTHDHAICNC